MLTHIIHSLWILYALFLHKTTSFSACDEIDITFVIDTDSIIANSDGVIKFITNIIQSGSSEQAGFSAVIYGHNIPIHQKIKIISLHDTKDATQRRQAEQKVDNKLKKAFNSIIAISANNPKSKKYNHYAAHTMESPSADDDDDDDPKPDKTNDNDDPKPDKAEKKHAKSGDTHYHPVEKWNKNIKKESSEAEPEPKKRSKSRERRRSGDRDGAYENGAKTKTIALLAAFKIATGQSRPQYKGTRMERLGYDPSDKNIMGDHDNQQVYIIFDHHNKVFQGPSEDVDVCKLFHHLDTNEIKNDDEAAYFMLGRAFSKGQTQSVFCDGQIPKYIEKNTFYQFSNEFAFNSEKMEHIYAITCPAEIKAPEYKGKINVGNHVQYIDFKTVIKCALFYIDHDDNRDTPKELDTETSYIMVKDFVNDDNTFQLHDSLLIPPSIIPQMKKRNCNCASMKIKRIVREDQTTHGTRDSNQANDYKILKLFVEKPGSPMEYIQDAKVHGRVKVHEIKGSHSGYGKPKKKPYNEYDDYGPASAKETEDNVFYTETQILRGDMDDIFEQNPFAANIGRNILKERGKRMKHVADRLATFKKIRHKLIKKFPHRKRQILSKTFAANLLDSNILNPFGISLKDLLLGRIKAEGDLRLVDIDFRREWIITKVGEEIEIKDGDTRVMCTILGIPIPGCGSMKMLKQMAMKGMGMRRRNRRRNRRRLGFEAGQIELSASGDGDLELRFGYLFRFIIGVKFKFFWQMYTPFIDITFVVYIEWDVGAFFYIRCKGEAQFNIDNILHWDKELRFSIGPVPVILMPYIDFFGSLETVPRPVYTGVSCRYNQRLELGFRFCTIPGCIPGPIKKKITKHKGCKKHLGLDHREEWLRDYGHNLQCPRGDRVMGFDIKFNVKLGVVLYSIVNIYLRFEFVIPFRVMYPTFNSKNCYLPGGMDMCKVTKKTQYLKAHFWVSMHMNIYLGIFVDFGNIVGMVLGIFGIPMPAAAAPEFEIKIIGPIPIIPKISLGCLDLKEHLLELDTALRHACCSHKTYLPEKPEDQYYDHNYMDNYRHTYSYGDQNPYYDHPYYEDQQFNDKNHFNIHDPYNYNEDNEYSTDYYSPEYHFPAEMKPWMKQWKKHHGTRNKMKRKWKISEVKDKNTRKKYPLPFDFPDWPY